MADVIPLRLGLSGAELSPDLLYRFSLWRSWNERGDRILWVMLNPSDADDVDNDPTVRKCIGFARRLGFGSIEIVNLYAFRTPFPETLLEKLRKHGIDYVVGPQNDARIVDACTRAKTVMAAWGSQSFIEGRARHVSDLLRAHHPNVLCLGRTKDGHPRHPSRLGYATVPQPL